MTIPNVTFGKKWKQITNRNTGNGIQLLNNFETYVTDNIHDSLKLIEDN